MGARKSCDVCDFYPRSPCGERHSANPKNRKWRSISIHALLAESDYCPQPLWSSYRYFYPRSPCGERPSALLAIHTKSRISIHALLAESDSVKWQFKRYIIISIHALLAESDDVNNPVLAVTSISIHALLAESDNTPIKAYNIIVRFLSTLSLRRATFHCFDFSRFRVDFYPRSPCGERHLRVLDGSKSSIISIHALLAESDVKFSVSGSIKSKFLSTLSLRRATLRHRIY